MPIYEYQCKACGHQLDALQKIADDHLVDCPECHQAELRRLVSAPQFRLKGAGWYETDFKKDKRRNLAESADKPADAKKEKSGSDSPASGSSESKTAKPADKQPKADKSSATKSSAGNS